MAVSASVETANSLEPLPGWWYQRVASTAASKNPAAVPVIRVDWVCFFLLERLTQAVVVLRAMESLHEVGEVVLH